MLQTIGDYNITRLFTVELCVGGWGGKIAANLYGNEVGRQL